MEPLAELVEDRVAVGLGEAVLLVEDHDRTFPLARQADQGLELGADQIVIDHEDEQVRACGEVARLAFALGPPGADLGDARRVGEQDGPLDPLDDLRVLLAAAGRPHHGLGLADVLTEQGVDQRGLPRGARAEDDDVKPAPDAVGADRGELVAEVILGRLVLDLVDDQLGLIGLNLGGADDILGRASRARRASGVCPSFQNIRTAAIDDATARIDVVATKAIARASECLARRVVHLVDRRDQPGHRPERDGRQHQRKHPTRRPHILRRPVVSGDSPWKEDAAILAMATLPVRVVRCALPFDCAMSAESFQDQLPEVAPTTTTLRHDPRRSGEMGTWASRVDV